MGQNSSVAVGTTKGAPGDNGDIIVDASDSCVSGVKLRSTGIIPISELIKQEKCSKNIQKIEKNYYNRRKNINKQPNEKFKSKKVKAEFIETSFEDVPTRRQWVRVNSEPKNSFECDAIKIGLKKPSKTILNDNKIGVQNEFRDYDRARSSEPNPEKSQRTKRENIRGDSQNYSAARGGNKKIDVQEDVRPSTRKGIRKNVGTGTQEFNNKDISRKSIKKPEKKNFVAENAKKPYIKNINATAHKFKESSTQTITRDKVILYENVRQLYKRNDYDEKKRSKNNYQNRKELHEHIKKEGNKIKQQYQPQQQLHPQKQFKHNKKEKVLKNLEEESTHQIQTHDISHPKRKLRKYRQHLTIKTTMLCSIPPEKYIQCESNENKLGRCAGRNYINRKVAGEYYSGEEKYAPFNNDVNSLDSSNMAESSTSLLPSASTLEQAIKEHRKYVSAKEALASWKNLHTWKQHKKQFERSRNQFHQDNFDVATQTMFVSPKSIVRRNRSNHHFLQTYPVMQDDMIVPSEKHLYKDFIVKMEHCLQKHSRLCELNTKRNGEAKYTWVQDKYRRWHKITFDDYKN